MFQMNAWTIWVEALLNTSFLLHRHNVSRCPPQRFKSGLPKAPVPNRTPVTQRIAQLMQECSKYPNIIGSTGIKTKKTGKYFFVFAVSLNMSRRLFSCSESVPVTPNMPVCHVTDNFPIVLLLKKMCYWFRIAPVLLFDPLLIISGSNV